MPKILLTKTVGDRLRPYDEASAEFIRPWPVDRTLLANARWVRDPIHHRRTMALVSKLWKAGIIEANSMRAAIEIAKYATGFVDPIKKLDGTTDVLPRSISYAKTEEDVYRQEFAEPLRIEARKLLDMDDPNVRNEFEGLL